MWNEQVVVSLERFDELIFQHDLWSTLDFDGCILLYSTRNSHSYKYAMKKLCKYF